ncbi:hypothetical protein NDU88_003929 [Pleurodeles waltl]|uniref:Uncharacterized protein n=1 Tax=Pleurodeles waltl TaxID=8319 RepID=A0AAV7PEI9_PLEWA|nr:hypothetical protein NDU88_003929 [Pleurodeles waltl]
MREGLGSAWGFSGRRLGWVAVDLKNVSAGDLTVMDSRLVLRRQHLGRRQIPVGAKEGNLRMTMTEELPTS